MAIDTTYKEILTEKIISNLIHTGSVLSLSNISLALREYINLDLTVPLFKASTYKVIPKQNSSATFFTNCYSEIANDLTVLYAELFKISEQSSINFDRWKAVSQLLESQINDLSRRLDILLSVSQDTLGYLNYIFDNFETLSKVDLASTTLFFNPEERTMTLTDNNAGYNLIDTSNIKNSDIEFSATTKVNLVGMGEVAGSKKNNIFSSTDSFWQSKMYLTAPLNQSLNPVDSNSNSYLIIKLSNTPIQISKISIDFHMSNTSGTSQIAIYYSLDKTNWSPITYQTIVDKVSITFDKVETCFLKIEFNKDVDYIQDGQYVYEFGINNLKLYLLDYTTDTEQVFYSKALSVLKPDNTIQEFNKVALEVCESLPIQTYGNQLTDTSIDYYVAASDTPDFSITTANWISIDPTTRKNPKYPINVEFAEKTTTTINGVVVSHDLTTSPYNPKAAFTGITSLSPYTTSTITSSASRYLFINQGDHILNYEIATTIDIPENGIEIWRNVRNKSTTEDSNNNLKQVRNSLNGWRYNNSYYQTTVYVSNASGLSIDVGPNPIVIDYQKYTGKTVIPYGTHIVQIYKDNWLHFSLYESGFSGLTSLSTLKARDTLYPYNHKALIEGVIYDPSWPDTDPKLYQGCDIVAEYKMKEVSPFDFTYNTLSNDYNKFAIDLDAADSGATIDGTPSSTKNPMRCFLVKIDNSYSDFINETFNLYITTTENNYKYVRLKAVMKTTNINMTPTLDGYIIKYIS